MNFSRQKTVFALLLLLLFTSCHDVKKQKQLALIDQMIGQLDHFQQAMDEMDETEMDEIIASVSQVVDKIKHNYNSEDTISIEFAQRLENYKSIYAGLFFVRKTSSKLKASIPEEKKELLQLKSDIQKGVGDRSKYDSYIQFEKNKISQLNVLSENCVTTKTKCVDSYHQLHNEIQAFSEEF